MSRIETRVRKLEGARWTGRAPCCVVFVEPGETGEQAVERHLREHPEVIDYSRTHVVRLIVFDD